MNRWKLIQAGAHYDKRGEVITGGFSLAAPHSLLGPVNLWPCTGRLPPRARRHSDGHIVRSSDLQASTPGGCTLSKRYQTRGAPLFKGCPAPPFPPSPPARPLLWTNYVLALRDDHFISASHTRSSSTEHLCKSLGFGSSSNFVDCLSGSAWLWPHSEAVVCKHSPKGT